MRKLNIFFLSLILIFAISTGVRAEFFSDVIVTSPNGIWTDSRAYATLNAAITAVGANQRTIVIANAHTVTALTVPANVTLKFERDGSITNSGQLTINTKNIIADDHQIFTGTGDIDFAQGTIVKSSWFNGLYNALTLTSDDIVTMLITKQETLHTSVAVGNNVILKFDSQLMLGAAAGITLSNIGQVEAGLYQIFSGAGNYRFRDGTILNLSWFNNLRAAITHASTNKLTLLIQGIHTVDLSDNIPTTLTTKLVQGGILSISPGVTLTYANIRSIDIGSFDHDPFSNTGSIAITDGLTYSPASGLTALILSSRSSQYEVDALLSYGSGVNYTDTTIMAACTAVGLSYKTILIRPGIWTQIANRDYTSICPNAFFKFAPSAVISQGAFTVKLPNKEIDPTWFGNLADNSTDNTTALQNAINAASVGATVKVPFGISRFTNLNISTANVTLEGDSWGNVLSTTMAADSDTEPALWIKASGVKLKNFKITWATLPSAAQYGTSVEKNDTIAIGTIAYGPPAPAQLSKVVVEDVYVYGGKQHGISLGNTTDCKIINNRVEEVYGTGIWPYNSSNLKVIDNYVYRTMDAGIDVTSDTTTYSQNVTITDNLVENTNIGIGSHGGRGVNISDNIIDNTWSSAIYCQESVLYGNPAPFVTNVTGNVIRKPFQFYGAGNFHLLDRYTTSTGDYSIIEVLSTSETNISDNVVNDDSGLQSHSGIHASGTKVSISENTMTLDGSKAFYIAPIIADDYTDIGSLTMTGNNVSISSGNGSSLMFLNGVGGGTITGNYFDCGGQGLASPNGRFITAAWTKDLLISANNILNYTDSLTDNGNNGTITIKGNLGLGDNTLNNILQQDVITLTDAIIITPAQMRLGIIGYNNTTSANINLQLPTKTDLDATGGLLIGESFEWTIINGSANANATVTITANTGSLVFGIWPIMSSFATTGRIYGLSSTFRTMRQSTGDYITFQK